MPDGFMYDVNSRLYYLVTQGNDDTGQPGKWVTWFYPETGKYVQQFTPDAPTVAMSTHTPRHAVAMTAHTLLPNPQITGKKKLSPAFIIIPVAVLVLAVAAAFIFLGDFIGNNGNDSSDRGRSVENTLPPDVVRPIEISIMSQVFPVSPFYNEGVLSGALWEEHYELQRAREAQAVTLSNDIYAYSRQLQGQYEALGEAVQRYFDTLPAYSSENVRNALQADREEITTTVNEVLAELEYFAEMREMTFEEAKDTRQDPYIAASLTYMSAVYSMTHAAVLLENTFVLVTQCMYLMKAYPEGDVAALDAAVDMVDAHSGSFFYLSEQVNQIIEILDDMDRHNMVFANRTLRESIAESEHALKLLEELYDDIDLPDDDMELINDILRVSIELDKLYLEVLDKELGQLHFVDPVSFTAGGYNSNIEVSALHFLSVENNDYAFGSDTQYQHVSFRSFMWNRLKTDSLELAETVMMGVRAVSDMAGEAASGVAEVSLSVARAVHEAAVATLQYADGRTDGAGYRTALKEVAMNAGRRIIAVDSELCTVSNIRGWIASLDPIDASKEVPISPLGVGWLLAYQAARNAGLSTVDKILTLADKNATPEERDSAVIGLFIGGVVGQITEIKGIGDEILAYAEIFDAVSDISGRAAKRLDKQSQSLDETVSKTSGNVCRRTTEVADRRDPGRQQGGNQQGGGQQGGNQQGGDPQGGNQQGGDAQGGNQQGGDPQGGSAQPSPSPIVGGPRDGVYMFTPHPMSRDPIGDAEQANDYIEIRGGYLEYYVYGDADYTGPRHHLYIGGPFTVETWTLHGRDAITVQATEWDSYTFTFEDHFVWFHLQPFRWMSN